MSLLPASPDRESTAGGASLPDTRLYGRWLIVARVGWLVVVIYSLALFVGSLPAYYALIQTPCSTTAGAAFPCGNLNGGLDAAGIRALQAAGFSLSGHAIYIIALTVAVSVVWVAVGLVIFWRRSDDWVALLGALALLVYFTGQGGGPTTGLLITYPAWTIPVGVNNLLGGAALQFFLFLFPNGRFAPRWMFWVLAVNLPYGLFASFLPADSSITTSVWWVSLTSVLELGTFALLIFSQIYRYRRVSNAVQRQQVKWAVFGIVLSLVLIIVVWITTIVLSLNRQGTLSFLGEIVSDTGWLLGFLPIPIFIGLAIMRSRLWDIDAIINRALVYGALTALLGALYAGLIIGLTSLAGLFGGTAAQNPVVLVIATLAIAALFQPARRRIQNVIDRRFYRRKYDAEKTLAAFSAALRNEVDLEQLREHLLAVVQETMQPAHLSLWLRTPERQTTEPAQRLD